MALVENLPPEKTSFIGREQELAQLRHLLTTTRILTITGPGGIGKTRLALRLAADVRDQVADGVCFVSLAGVRDLALVVPTVAQALDVRDSDGKPLLEQLVAFLQEKRVLLILDNAEQVRDATRELVLNITSTSHSTLIITSRSALRLSDEQEFPLAPLPLPEASEPSVATAAVDLFVARAQLVKPDFSLNETNGATIAAICRRLDGLPLAIELAAARSKLLPPTALLTQLNERMVWLHSRSADTPDRHRTLHDAIAWSDGLLQASEQHLFWRLGVFMGSFSLEAAHAVGGDLDSGSLLRSIEALVDQSLVCTIESEGEARFGLLETIREYAFDRLIASGKASAVQDAHASYYAGLARRAANELHGPDQLEWLAQLDTEEANLRSALNYFIEKGRTTDALAIIESLHWFWLVRGHFTEGRRWIEGVLTMLNTPPDSSPPAALVARARYAAGRLASSQADFGVAASHLQASIADWRSLVYQDGQNSEAQQGLVEALTYFIVVCNLQSDTATAAGIIPEYLALASSLPNARLQAMHAFNMGRGLLLQNGDVATAKPHLLRALELLRKLGDLWYIAQVVLDLGLVALWEGDSQIAQGYYTEALELALALKDRSLAASAYNNLGEAARLAGDDVRAGEAYAASLRMFRERGNRSEIPRILHNQGYLALHAGAAQQARACFAESLALFRAIDNPRGVAEALAGFAAVAAFRNTPEEAERAARLWGAAEAIHQTVGTPVWPVDSQEQARYQALARSILDETLFAKARANGRTLSLDEACALAYGADDGRWTMDDGNTLATDNRPPTTDHRYQTSDDLQRTTDNRQPTTDHRQPTTDNPEALTMRETEILRLVASGLSNQKIADELHLSVYTVQNHLRNIYGKLGITSRSAATRYAWEHHLVASDSAQPNEGSI